MIFPSYVFLLAFLPAVLLWWTSRLPFRVRLFGLTFASYVFYGWWDYRFTALMLATTLVDYLCGAGVARARSATARRRYLAASVLCNLGSLGFFKYQGFFVASAAAALAEVGFEPNLPLLQVVLPLGISFYTFQSLSYTLDIHRGEAEPAPDFLHFAAYVSLFPQLVAGPIVRYREMAEQLRTLETRRIGAAYAAVGIHYLVLGLAKKLLLADFFAPHADAVFDGEGPVQLGAAWLGTVAYTLQIYFDFSGYSDMAIGLGLMLGFRLPINFASPYRARDISEFWNRWHITLSHFLRDYLYIPLGGSRGGRARTARNLVITMFLGGLWHGAAWTFVAWGLLHGAFLAVHATLRERGLPRLPRPLGIAVTLLCVMAGWVLFRSPDFARALEVYAGLVGAGGVEASFFTHYASKFGELPRFVHDLGGVRVLAVLVLGCGIALFAPNSHRLASWQGPRWAMALAVAATACLFQLSRETPFLYFQF